MSSHGEYRRRDRSWDKDDRDRRPTRGGYRDAPRRRSRSRSPRRNDKEAARRRSRSRSPRRGDRDWERRREHDRREPGRDREPDRKERPRDRREERRRDENRDRDRDSVRDETAGRDVAPPSSVRDEKTDRAEPSKKHPNSSASHDLPDGTDVPEDGEAMDAVNDDDAAMMAMMGLTGFGTTKGKQVEGNQEGTVQIKKIRTWRQYMNRRGGFNRPLDKIK